MLIQEDTIPKNLTYNGRYGQIHLLLGCFQAVNVWEMELLPAMLTLGGVSACLVSLGRCVTGAWIDGSSYQKLDVKVLHLLCVKLISFPGSCVFIVFCDYSL